MNIKEIINAVASDTDREHLKRLPCALDLYEVLLRVIPFDPTQEISVADLGAGTGFLSALVLDRYPKARITLIDTNEDLLEKSRKRLQKSDSQLTWLQADYVRTDPPGKYDLIVTAMSVHHLNEIDKRALFRTLYSRLNSGGFFVIADRIKAPTENLRDTYRAFWTEDCRNAGADEEAIAASLERMADDHDSYVYDQHEWLRNAGFHDVDIYYKNQMFAVFGGQKPDY